MNAAEKAGIQGAIEKMQSQWNNFAMMKNPTVGSLVSFDEGLMVTPPNGLEIGYVPIVVKQKAAAKSAVDKALAAIFLAGNNIESILKEAADKAAADKAAAKKPKTITCVKRKITKKVTAVKPVCPSGYKKK